MWLNADTYRTHTEQPVRLHRRQRFIYIFHLFAFEWKRQERNEGNDFRSMKNTEITIYVTSLYFYISLRDPTLCFTFAEIKNLFGSLINHYAILFLVPFKCCLAYKFSIRFFSEIGIYILKPKRDGMSKT